MKISRFSKFPLSAYNIFFKQSATFACTLLAENLDSALIKISGNCHNVPGDRYAAATNYLYRPQNF